jgi:hypothetical protein
MSTGKRLLAVVLALLLLLFAVRGVVLSLVGESAQAVVTGTKRVVDQTSDRMDHNYRISYRFQVDGKSYTGSYQMRKVYNITRLPGKGDTLRVRYLAAFPQWNASSRESPLGGLLIGGVGLLILGAAFKPRRRQPTVGGTGAAPA